MTLVDSHTHLDMGEFDADRDAVLARADESGVRALLCPIEISNSRSAEVILGLAGRRPAVFAAAGLHPHQAAKREEGLWVEIEKLASAGKIRAVGEIGLDFHYSFSTPEEQKQTFREQLILAERLGLPAIVHSRAAAGEIALIAGEVGFSRGGVLHCFTEDWDFARKMMDAGFFISFSGIITFPNAGPLREVARRVPLDRLLVETDAPYLAPVPFRGRRNEPAYVVETARTLAGLRNLSPDEFSEAVCRNFDAFLALSGRPSAAAFEKTNPQC